MSPHPIDLDRLPPELRRLVEQQLAKLPPQAREKLLREGSPMLEKMIARLGGQPPPLPGQAAARAAQQARASAQHAAQNVSAAADRASDIAQRIARVAPKGHYNATIRPGDASGGGRWLAVAFVVAVLVAIYWR